MDEKLKLTEERKQQLVNRVQKCLEDDVLNLMDWMKMYDIMLEACDRESKDCFERMMIESIEGEGNA